MNSVLKSEFRLGFGATKDEHSETIKFLLPWNMLGSNAMSAFDVNLKWKSPLDPKVWKRESPGERVRVGVNPYGSWNRIAAWLPWMEMGQSPGHLFYRSHPLKVGKVEDLPPHILAYTRAVGRTGAAHQAS